VDTVQSLNLGEAQKMARSKCAGEPDVRWVVPADLTGEKIAEARQALEDLAKLLGRVSAKACHELGITFDMDDPEVAREVMKMRFEALVYSPRKPARKATVRRTS
jgi:hypothetical protein